MNEYSLSANCRPVLLVVVAISLFVLTTAIKADSLRGVNFNGVNQTQACGNCAPPDTHGGVGDDQYVQIVNKWVRVYSKTVAPGTTTLTLLSEQSLASFFQYVDTDLFDPRVVFDSVAHRWIITAEAFPFSPTLQWQFIAVSNTNDATDVFNFYAINVNFLGNDFFWDYPQLGLSENAVIITANIFDSTGSFVYSNVISISKSDLYNNQVLTYSLFQNLLGESIAPPIVIGSNPDTYLISAAPDDNVLRVYDLRNAGTGSDLLLGPNFVAVAPYIHPGAARQPGTGATLDASDSRFVNASLQKGDALWQIHTIGNGGYVTPKFYLIDLSQMNVAWTDLYFATNTSDDFNASITANPTGERFITWTSTDVANGTNAQARYIGTGVFGPSFFTGKSAYDSPISYGVAGTQRWGDYSAITIDPADTTQAWAVNEIVDTQTTWGTRIFNIGIP